MVVFVAALFMWKSGLFLVGQIKQKKMLKKNTLFDFWSFLKGSRSLFSIHVQQIRVSYTQLHHCCMLMFRFGMSWWHSWIHLNPKLSKLLHSPSGWLHTSFTQFSLPQCLETLNLLAFQPQNGRIITLPGGRIVRRDSPRTMGEQRTSCVRRISLPWFERCKIFQSHNRTSLVYLPTFFGQFLWFTCR